MHQSIVIGSVTPELTTHRTEVKDKRQWDVILDWASIVVVEEAGHL